MHSTVYKGLIFLLEKIQGSKIELNSYEKWTLKLTVPYSSRRTISTVTLTNK